MGWRRLWPAALVALAGYAGSGAALAQVPGGYPTDPTLGLTLTATGDLGTLVPSVSREYTMNLGGMVTSTAARSALSVVDPSGFAPGHLVNGTTALPQPLQMTASGSFGAVSGAPLTLVTYATPVLTTPVTIRVKQAIAATDPLVQGSYGKTLTFTLTAVQP